MALKWKKDGTATFGLRIKGRSMVVYVVKSLHGYNWWASIGASAKSYRTEAQAKSAAEAWLRKQAAKMLSDLGGK